MSGSEPVSPKKENAGDELANAAAKKATRPVAKAACLSCRERKIRCEGVQDCSYCKQMKLPCVFVKSHRGGRRRRKDEAGSSAKVDTPPVSHQPLQHHHHAPTQPPQHQPSTQPLQHQQPPPPPPQAANTHFQSQSHSQHHQMYEEGPGYFYPASPGYDHAQQQHQQHHQGQPVPPLQSQQQPGSHPQQPGPHQQHAQSHVPPQHQPHVPAHGPPAHSQHISPNVQSVSPHDSSHSSHGSHGPSPDMVHGHQPQNPSPSHLKPETGHTQAQRPPNHVSPNHQVHNNQVSPHHVSPHNHQVSPHISPNQHPHHPTNGAAFSAPAPPSAPAAPQTYKRPADVPGEHRTGKKQKTRIVGKFTEKRSMFTPPENTNQVIESIFKALNHIQSQITDLKRDQAMNAAYRSYSREQGYESSPEVEQHSSTSSSTRRKDATSSSKIKFTFTSEDLISLDLPCIDVINLFIDLYYEYFHPNHPFLLPKRIFLRNFSPRTDVSVLHAMFAVSCRFASLNMDAIEQEASRQLVPYLLDPQYWISRMQKHQATLSSVEHVKCMLLSGHALFFSGHAEKGRNFIQSAYQLIKMHKLEMLHSANPDGINTEMTALRIANSQQLLMRESLIRTLWELWEIRVMVATFLIRPDEIPEFYTRICLPCSNEHYENELKDWDYKKYYWNDFEQCLLQGDPTISGPGTVCYDVVFKIASLNLLASVVKATPGIQSGSSQPVLAAYERRLRSLMSRLPTFKTDNHAYFLSEFLNTNHLHVHHQEETPGDSDNGATAAFPGLRLDERKFSPLQHINPTFYLAYQVLYMAAIILHRDSAMEKMPYLLTYPESEGNVSTPAIVENHQALNDIFNMMSKEDVNLNALLDESVYSTLDFNDDFHVDVVDSILCRVPSNSAFGTCDWASHCIWKLVNLTLPDEQLLSKHHSVDILKQLESALFVEGTANPSYDFADFDDDPLAHSRGTQQRTQMFAGTNNYSTASLNHSLIQSWLHISPFTGLIVSTAFPVLASVGARHLVLVTACKHKMASTDSQFIQRHETITDNIVRKLRDLLLILRVIGEYWASFQMHYDVASATLDKLLSLSEKTYYTDNNHFDDYSGSNRSS
ncbi:hypothetical protein CJU90_6828 [Yarrowia sp. C11]|nr:hypothetical protein CJU90_6828 [Yarrowia sp. C11]